MSATAEEVGWAREIKAAALAKGLEAVPDFEYLQHAIVSKGNTGKALKRVERMAAFRKEYGLSTAEKDDARALLDAVNKLFPGFMPGLGRDGQGHGVQMAIYRVFHPAKLRGEKEWRDMMGAFYYLFNALNADVADIRAGIVFACDCSGMGWDNFSLEAEKRAAAFYQDAYPVRMKHCYMIDAPFILNSMIAVVKIFLSKKIRDIIQLEKSGPFFASGKVPKDVIPAAFGGMGSEEKAVQWFDERLAIRTANENTFSLSN